jgi:hypothetical protein
VIAITDSRMEEPSAMTFKDRKKSVVIPELELPKLDQQKSDLPKPDLPKVDIPEVDLPKDDLPILVPKKPKLWENT